MTTSIRDYMVINGSGTATEIKLSYYDSIKAKLPYRYIDIDHDLQQLISVKSYKYIMETGVMDRIAQWNWVDTADYLKCVPELVNAMKLITPSPITFVAFPARKAGLPLHPHVDATFGCRVLFPVKNCIGSQTKFYDLNGNNIYYRKSKIDSTAWWELEDKFPLKEIASVELYKPIVFDAQVPHEGIANPHSEEIRFTMTIGFEKEPRSYLYNSILKRRT